ncbi:MAG: NPCBM/NEW2 domain-containing protein, partial [Planctomycetes bacterium]|nr:NPCBM/NEW2 domain-containing protein [Planctomycetota bacterium]
IPIVQDQVIARMRDGAVFPFVPEELTNGLWRGRLPWGGRLELKSELVASFDRIAGPFLDLARVDFEEVDFESGEVLNWAPRLHQSVSGRALRIAEQDYPWGIGVRAPTTMSWRLPSPGVLTVECGVDEEVLRHRNPAPLSFQVLLDGEVLAERNGVERQDGLIRMQVALPRSGLLSLRCLSEGEEGASGRHGDWIAPRYWPSEGRL